MLDNSTFTSLNVPRGEDHPCSRFTDDDIRAMRRRRKAGELLKAIALDYKTAPTTVRKICLREAWKHVPEEA